MFNEQFGEWKYAFLEAWAKWWRLRPMHYRFVVGHFFKNAQVHVLIAHPYGTFFVPFPLLLFGKRSLHEWFCAPWRKTLSLPNEGHMNSPISNGGNCFPYQRKCIFRNVEGKPLWWFVKFVTKFCRTDNKKLMSSLFRTKPSQGFHCLTIALNISTLNAK